MPSCLSIPTVEFCESRIQRLSSRDEAVGAAGAPSVIGDVERSVSISNQKE